MCVIVTFFVLVLIVGLCGGISQPIAGFLTVGSIAVLVALIISSIVDHYKEKQRRLNSRPVITDYIGNRKAYVQAVEAWDKAHEPPLSTLPLNERLAKRNTKHRIDHNTDAYDMRCLICGGRKSCLQSYCSECMELYKKAPKTPLPEGITERYRMALWAVRQSIIVDYLDGKIDEATVKAESLEAVGYIRHLIQRNQAREDAQAERKRQHELYLQKRAKASEGLLPK